MPDFDYIGQIGGERDYDSDDGPSGWAEHWAMKRLENKRKSS
jgi:hypothetical protein